MNLSQKWLLDYVDVSEVEPHEFKPVLIRGGINNELIPKMAA